ncbi:MAG: N-6 DNA methylase [Gemmatimonadaceae bacterium]|nr:N-6 DNA methylase [Gemmatimonadaceae bacterium]
MLSVREARGLLEKTRTNDGLLCCANALGFTRSTTVGIELQQKLGLGGLGRSFDICDGRGTLRALVVCLRECESPRETLTKICKALSATAPHLLWVIVSGDGVAHFGIGVWRSEHRRIRVHALLADPRRISDSDAHTLCALSSGSSTSDSITHLRWTEILGRDAVTIKFFRALRGVLDGLSESAGGSVRREEADDLALVCVSRLLFLSFIETRGWLNGDHDFLSNSFIQCMTSGGSYHKRVLTPLFFGTLNTPVAKRAPHARDFGRVPFLNGGLFARTHTERLHRFTFSDDALGQVFGNLLTRYRFTGQEQMVDISDSAIDPEILGRAFESLMQRDSRKATGAFYTPHAVVQRVADAALEASLGSRQVPTAAISALLSGSPVAAAEQAALNAALAGLRILDPACGSGAFLVYLLEKLAEMHGLCGDKRSIGDRRRMVLANSIFGVDINPTAVWLCELRLWLCVVIHTEGSRVMPLPNLDRNIRVGDSLGAARPVRPGIALPSGIERTRRRYVRSVGSRKKLLARQLERLERRNAIQLLKHEIEAIDSRRRDLLSSVRSRNLFGERASNSDQREQLRTCRVQKLDAKRAVSQLQSGGALPFSFQTHFSEAFHDGGFDLVVGNPPWVRVHQIGKSTREALRKHFELFRLGGWTSGALRANAASGFSNQLDLSALFVERSISVTRDGGSIALLLPAKLWKSLAGGSVRSLIAEKCEIRVLEDFSEAKAMFEATTYPSLLVARRRQAACFTPAVPVRATVHRRREVLHWTMSPDLLALDESRGSPWLLVPGEVRAGFDKMSARGVPMSESAFGRPLLGVKTGLNAAFVLPSPNTDTAVERYLVRRVVKGDAIAQWRIEQREERIIWTHDAKGVPLQSLPPLASAWFKSWQKPLMARVDARGENRWWRLFRTEAAESSLPRVVWADIGRRPQAAVLGAGDNSIPLNSCYVIKCRDELDSNALAALLNSPLIAAWLALIAEPAQGGYNRYLGWTMSMLPIPRDWDRHKRSMAEIYERAAAGKPPDPRELFMRSLRLYGLVEEEVHDMMAWAHW